MKKIAALATATAVLFSLLTGCVSPAEHPTEPELQTAPSQATDAPTDPPVTDAPTDVTTPITTPPTEATEPSEDELPDLDEPLFLGDTYNDTYQYVNCNGTILSEMMTPSPYYSENGLAAAPSQATGLVGFVDRDGVFVIEPQFQDAAPFGKHGLAAVAVEGEEYYEKKWGYINEQGEIVVPCDYDYATPLNSAGYGIVGKSENDIWSYGVIDSNGCFCIPLDTEHRRITLADNCVIIELRSTTKDTTATGDHVSIHKKELRDFNNNVIDSVEERSITKCVSTDAIDSYCAQYPNDLILYSEDLQKYVHHFSDFTGEYECIRGTLYKSEYYNHTYDENGVPSGKDANLYILLNNGFKKIDASSDFDWAIDKKQVATTLSGYGHKIIWQGNDLSSYEYDTILRFYTSPFVLAIKQLDAEGQSCAIDIFDLRTGTKTAEDIPYALYFSDQTIVPDGYYIFSTYQNGNLCYGVIDYTGKLIMEPIYEEIMVYTYDALLAKMMR